MAGQDTAVSGTVAIPPGPPPPGGWPTLSWAHGAAGLADECAPSRDAPGRSSHIYAQLADAVLSQWVRRGWAVARTDYQGLGTPGPHPYLIGAAAARGITDIVGAARQLEPGIGRRWAVLGHAQGGHGALFAAALAPGWAPDLDLIGAVAMAPADGALDRVAWLRDATGPVPGLEFLALTLIGAAAADPRVRLDELLTGRALRLLDMARAGSIDDLLAPGWRPAPEPGGPFRPGARLGPLMSVLAANDPASLVLRAPALIVQGSDDPIAIPARTDRVARALSAKGAVIDFHGYPGRGHFDVIAAAHGQTAQWIDTRLAQPSPVPD
jgi:hypothetical protein